MVSGQLETYCEWGFIYLLTGVAFGDMALKSEIPYRPSCNHATCLLPRSASMPSDEEQQPETAELLALC